jgi:hypothetical protein
MCLRGLSLSGDGPFFEDQADGASLNALPYVSSIP